MVENCILQWINYQPKCSAASAASQQLTVGLLKLAYTRAFFCEFAELYQSCKKFMVDLWKPCTVGKPPPDRPDKPRVKRNGRNRVNCRFAHHWRHNDLQAQFYDFRNGAASDWWSKIILGIIFVWYEFVTLGIQITTTLIRRNSLLYRDRRQDVAHRKWRETKQQLIWLPDLALLCCYSVSLFFQCDILSTGPVLDPLPMSFQQFTTFKKLCALLYMYWLTFLLIDLSANHGKITMPFSKLGSIPSILLNWFSPDFTYSFLLGLPPSSADPFHRRMPIAIDEIEMELGGDGGAAALLKVKLSLSFRAGNLEFILFCHFLPVKCEKELILFNYKSIMNWFPIYYNSNFWESTQRYSPSLPLSNFSPF